MARRTSIALTLALAGALAFGSSTAGAVTQSFHDKGGDAKGTVDLKSARVDYDGTTLQFKIKTWEGLPGKVVPSIEIGRQVFIVGNNALDDQTGQFLFKVKETKTHRSVTYRFSPSDLSTPPPGSIRWRAVAIDEEQIGDVLPNKGFSKLPLTQ